MSDKSCKTPRWRMLKSHLNNLLPKKFYTSFSAAESPILIDVRTPEEFQRGYIKDAVNLNYLENMFWDNIERLPKGKQYFVYCRTGRRSIRACTLMRNGGFNNTDIFNLEGGFILWQQEGLPEVYPGEI